MHEKQIDWSGKLRLLPLGIDATTQGVRLQGTIETTQAVIPRESNFELPYLHE